jgi:hypothetical protein
MEETFLDLRNKLNSENNNQEQDQNHEHEQNELVADK